MSLINTQIKPFKATAYHDGKFVDITEQNLMGKWSAIVFYPADFTFVCPTELHAFQEKLEEFKKRDVELIACSIDSKFSHFAWLNTPRDQGGIQGVQYPILADIHRTIARDYDVLSDDGVAYRGLFLIDKQGIVRHQLVNDGPLGRNVDDTLRLIDALHHVEKHGEVCPANWNKGKDAMKATHEGVSTYLAKH